MTATSPCSKATSRSQAEQNNTSWALYENNNDRSQTQSW